MVKDMRANFSKNNSLDAEYLRGKRLYHVPSSEIETTLIKRKSDTGLKIKLSQTYAPLGALCLERRNHV